jgi:hypothetical protein
MLNISIGTTYFKFFYSIKEEVGQNRFSKSFL